MHDHSPASQTGRNWTSAARAVLLLLFAACIIGLWAKGDMPLYIHPRYIPYSLGAAVVLALMGLAQWQSFRKAGGATTGRAWGITVVFLVPLAMMLVPRATLGANLAAKEGVNLTNRGANTAATKPTTTEQVALVDGKAILTDGTYQAWLQEVYAHPQQYVGKPVTMTGFVYKPDGVKPDQIMLARLIVTCHIAHATADGFLVASAEAPNLLEDTWYQVDGVFVQDTYQGKPVVQIQATTLTPVLMPAQPYIFP